MVSVTYRCWSEGMAEWGGRLCTSGSQSGPHIDVHAQVYYNCRLLCACHPVRNNNQIQHVYYSVTRDLYML